MAAFFACSLSYSAVLAASIIAFFWSSLICNAPNSSPCCVAFVTSPANWSVMAFCCSSRSCFRYVARNASAFAWYDASKANIKS